MKRVVSIWSKLKGWRILILAGVLTGAEGLITLGIPLPGAELIPLKYRGLAIFALTVSAFILRTLAARSEAKRG